MVARRTELAYNIGIGCGIRIVSLQKPKAVTLRFRGCGLVWRRAG